MKKSLQPAVKEITSHNGRLLILTNDGNKLEFPRHFVPQTHIAIGAAISFHAHNSMTTNLCIANRPVTNAHGGIPAVRVRTLSLKSLTH